MNSAVLCLKKGFSLLEVMTVVVIIAILATLAYPSLQGYLLRSKLTEAKVHLSAGYTAQKIYFATNQAYVDSPGKLDFEMEKGKNSLYEITRTGESSSFTATA